MLAIIVVLLITSVSLPVSKGTTRLEWFDVSDSSALCNDFTRAGFFLRRANASDKWIIFLESGGLCYSNDTCNRRFFLSEVSDRFNHPADSFEPYGNFDPAEAWNETVVSGREAAVDVVSPYMTSMRCFENKTDYFPQGFSVDGTDILDQDCEENPLFCDFNHVVVPYCSSDVWLGTEVDGMRNDTAADGECTQCFDYNQQNGCFRYNPRSESIQFTYRGRTIFMSVIRDLLAMGMDGAIEVVLAGSSAGGLGALNNAKWLQSELQSVSSAELTVIFDSAWFINFQGNIYREFDGTISRAESEVQGQNIQTLLSVLESDEACSDVRLGFPCCISPYCLLTQTNAAGESFYPKVPTFGIFSLYDIYLLAPSLAGLETIQNQEEMSIGYGIDFLLTVGEYGGEMNKTVMFAETQTDFFSYYATQCSQHVYLATSSLWGLPGASVFGRSSVELQRNLASFRYSLQSGIWNSRQLAGASIQEALIQWYSNRTLAINLRDNCSGPHCNNQCPEEFLLGELDSNDWSVRAKAVIVGFVIGITVLCVLLKIVFYIWQYWLQKKQNWYRKALMQCNKVEGTKKKFPELEEEERITVSCHCLRYSVPFSTKMRKDEKEDSLPFRVLHNVIQGDNDAAVSPESEPEDKLWPAKERTGLKSAIISRNPSVEDLASRSKDSLLLRGNDTPKFGLNPVFGANLNVSSVYSPGTRRSENTHTGVNELDCHPGQLYREPSILGGTEGRGIEIVVPTQNPDLQSSQQRLGEQETPPYQRQPQALTMTSPDTRSSMNTATEKDSINILKGISTTFECGELTGIMGSSGSGKTTFLDLLTARRKTGTSNREICINGDRMEEVLEDYIANTGYVLQLAAPYYEELTVCENLTLAALIKLPWRSTTKIFERVDLVMRMTGIQDQATKVVGGLTGPGLSGGQKRRLLLALQLLKLPKVIFLDEPISGLDSSSAYDLFTSLHNLAHSKRTIVLTIHRPGPELFDLFDKIVLLSDGKIAYDGEPKKMYEVFVQALDQQMGLDKSLLAECKPYDVIQDVLGDPDLLRVITESHNCQPPCGTDYPVRTDKRSGFSFPLAGQFRRLAALEARASKRDAHLWKLYFPLTFFIYGLLLGTVYLQQSSPFLIASGFAAFSFASSIVMFPMLYRHYIKALEIFRYEHWDAVGWTHDLIIQGFCRAIFLAALPVIICTGMLYVLLIRVESYDLAIFGQVLIVNLALNQTWTALNIALICTWPDQAIHLSTVISSIAGFTAGFFIPIKQIPWWYRWLSYINPNYYGFSASAHLLLDGLQTDCSGTQFECFTTSGEYVLGQFSIEDVNPYLHILFLLILTVIFCVLAWFGNWWHYNHTTVYKIKRVGKKIFCCMCRYWRNKASQLRDEVVDDLMTHLRRQQYAEETGSSMHIISNSFELEESGSDHEAFPSKKKSFEQVSRSSSTPSIESIDCWQAPTHHRYEETRDQHQETAMDIGELDDSQSSHQSTLASIPKSVKIKRMKRQATSTIFTKPTPKNLGLIKKLDSAREGNSVKRKILHRRKTVDNYMENSRANIRRQSLFT